MKFASYTDYKMAQYRATQPSTLKPRPNFVKYQQAKYEAAHEAMTPQELAGTFDSVITDLNVERRRMETTWPLVTIYPTAEALSIFGAVLEMGNEAIDQGVKLRSTPAIFAFEAPMEAISRAIDDVQKSLTTFIKKVNEPTAEAPQGNPIRTANLAGAAQVRVPALRSQTLSVMRAIIRAYETYDTVQGAVPFPTITNTVFRWIMKIKSGIGGTIDFINTTFGGIARVPAELRDKSEQIAKVIKYSTIAGIGIMLYWALKPSKKGTK